MKIYRLDFYDCATAPDRDRWRAKWFATKEEAESYQREANRCNECGWDLEEFEINETKNSFVGFLNYHAARITASD